MRSKKRSFPFAGMILGISMSMLILILLQHSFGYGVTISSVLQAWDVIMLGLLLLFAAVFMIAVRVWILSRHIGFRIRLIDCYSNSFLNQFFSAITPFAVGGQPFQIYDLTRLGLNVSTASAMVITMFLVSNLASVSLTLFVFPQFIWYFRHAGSTAAVIVVGALITVIVGGLLMVIALSERLITTFSRFLARRRFLLGILARLLKRDCESLSETTLNKFREYNESMKLIWRKAPRLLFLDYFLAIAHFLCLYGVFHMIAAILLKNNGGSAQLSFLDSVAIQSLLSFVVYYFPTPGSSGGFEGGMFILLKDIVRTESLPLLVTIWRFVTYHLLIFIGLAIFLLTLRRRTAGVIG